MDGLPDDWEMHFFGNLIQAPDGDFDEDFVPNLQEYLVGSDPTGGPPLLYVDRSVTSSGNGTSWQTAFRTIQEGISAATDGHAVVVAEGTYPEQIHFHGKRIRLRSTDPLDPVVVANTIIAAAKGGRVITFAGTEDETCVLSGFTIRNGKAPYGGGICGGTPTIHARATIEHNVITGNSATGDSASGGGIAFCDGRIQGNVILANMATGQNANGGGLGCCHGLIQNNVIGENFAEGEGGGLFDCDSVIRGNTISMNSALSGGGLAACDGMVKNCIIWGNLPLGADGELYLSSVPSFSCIEEWTGGGKGNISKIPRFVAPENHDFRLKADSPCIDAGSNDPDLLEFDIAGAHRIMFGGKSLTADMGAYEFYINKLEPVPGTDDVVFTWSCLAEKTYSIFYTEDLFDWHTAIDNFPSSGNTTTSWTDDGVLTDVPPSLAPKRFYRVLENP
ncbi:MAG: choice-of-anchor Q domain-containing protein [bacterium]|nr:choice-of-anchor Q domain-containing protein [bacterium]